MYRKEIDTCTGKKEKILGESGVAGALVCGSRAGCKGTLLNQPNGMVYKSPNLYIADSANNRVISWDGTSVTELIKNNNYESGKSNAGTSPNEFFMNIPVDVALDTDAKTLYVSDSFNHRILSQTLTDKKIQVFAGTGFKGFSGDFGDANLAQLDFPTGLAFYSESTTVSGTTTVSNYLYIADSGNNVIRRVSFLSDNVTPTPNPVYVIASSIGDSGEVAVPEDFVSTVKTQNTTAFSPDKGQRAVSEKKPVASSRELDDVLQDDGTGMLVYRKQLPSRNQAHFNFPTGISLNSRGDAFIVDSLNNQIKFALSEKTAESSAVLIDAIPQPSVLVDLGKLEKDNLTGRVTIKTAGVETVTDTATTVSTPTDKDVFSPKVYPVVRTEDYGNYRFTEHVFSGEHDYISPYPLQRMFFSVHGGGDKIVMCNISISGLKSEALTSNNFQFSLSLRNPVDGDF